MGEQDKAHPLDATPGTAEMKYPRRRFSPSVYRAILVKQAWRCACCGELFYEEDDENRNGPPPFHFDHILGIELGGKDEPENLQALKRGHHAKKTHKEASARAKTKRIIGQDGLRRKKESQYDKVMAKVVAK